MIRGRGFICTYLVGQQATAWHFCYATPELEIDLPRFYAKRAMFAGVSGRVVVTYTYTMGAQVAFDTPCESAVDDRLGHKYAHTHATYTYRPSNNITSDMCAELPPKLCVWTMAHKSEQHDTCVTCLSGHGHTGWTE